MSDFETDQTITSHVAARRDPELSFYRIIRALLLMTSLVVVALGFYREWFVAHYGVTTIFQDMRHIALDEEMCLGAWYGSSMMFAAAILQFAIGRLARHKREGDVGYWYGLSIVFIAMSLDEATSVHEVFLEPIAALFHASGPFTFAWVIPALVMVPAFGLAYSGFLRRLARPYGLWFFLSGAVFVAGALGMEMVGGVTFERYGEQGLPYILSFMTEESLEIFAMTSFVIALMSYLRQSYGLKSG